MLGLESTAHLLASVGIDNSNYMQSVHLTLSALNEYDQWFRGLLDQVIAERQSQVSEILSQIRVVYESWVLWVKETTGYEVVLQGVRDKLSEIKAANEQQYNAMRVGLGGGGGGSLKSLSSDKRKQLEALLVLREEEMLDYATLAALMFILTILLFIRYLRFLHRMRVNRLIAAARENA